LDIEQALIIAGNARRKYRGPFIYFFSSGDFIKIGWTSNVGARLSTCQSGNPLPIVLEASALGGATEEQLLHRHFEQHRFRAEWFHKCKPLERVIKKLAGHDPWTARTNLGEWYYRETGRGDLDPPEPPVGRLMAHEVGD